MTTAQQLIDQSLRVVGVIGAGETPAAEDSLVALDALNNVIGSLSLQRLVDYSETLNSHTLTVGQASYTIGTSGSPDWNTPRPNKIVNAFIRMNGNDYPVMLVDADTYDGYVDKTVQSNLPNRLFYDASFPNGTLYLYPAPSQANTLFLRYLIVLPETTIASLSTTTDFPPGYNRMLKWAVARELCPEYGKPVTAEIERNYIEALADLKRINARPIVGNTMELGTRSRYNIYSDTGS